MPNRRLLKFLAVLARYELKDFVFTSLDVQLLACSARVSLKSDSLLGQEYPDFRSESPSLTIWTPLNCKDVFGRSLIRGLQLYIWPCAA